MTAKDVDIDADANAMDGNDSKKFFNYDKEFGKLRGLYKGIGRLWSDFHFILKLLLKRHDLLASDRNINPDDWNINIRIFRNAYKTSYEVFCNEYLYNSRHESLSKHPRTREQFYCDMYNEVSQKSIRFLFDFITTMALEDTVYREMLNIWMFEMQFQMNNAHNPDRENKHVMYCNYLRNDMDYYNILSQVKNPEKVAKKKYHQALGTVQQRVYAEKRMKLELENSVIKAKNIRKVLKELKNKK